MTAHWRCCNGHQWETTASQAGGALDHPSCPQCGSPSIFPAGEDLPPCPPAVPLPPLPPHGDRSGAFTSSPGSSLSESAAETIRVLAAPQAAGELGRLGGYRVFRVLGAGAMGVVLAAEDPPLKRTVALKVLSPSLAGRPVARQRFLREAQAAAALDHPNIVTIYQVGEDRGVPFLAMQLLQGETLSQRLQREPVLTLPQVVRIGRQIAEGLAAAHAAGLIHRDIKPGNLFLASAGEFLSGVATGTGEDPLPKLSLTIDHPPTLKILDFGLARPEQDDQHLTQSGALVGTPAYMAPEQARGEIVDRRCDLFSLGCVLYQLCTGQAPFRGANTTAILLSLTLDEPRPAREINPDISPALADLIMRLLTKAPGDRPASAQAVADTLRGLEKQLSRQEPTGGGAHAKEEPAAPQQQPTQAAAKVRWTPRPWPVVPAAGFRRYRFLLVAACLSILVPLLAYFYFFVPTAIRFATPVSQEYEWTIKTPLPIPLGNHATAALDGLLYVVAGQDEKGPSDRLFFYDPETQRWYPGASLPKVDHGQAARYHAALGVLDGKLYLAGGWRRQPPLPTNSLFIYDPNTNDWRTGRRIPIPSGMSVTGVIDRKLYVLTSHVGDNVHDYLHHYDPDINDWRHLASAPRRYENRAGGVVDGKLYVVGGNAGANYTAALDVYDPATNSWETKAPMPTRRSMLAVGVLQGKLFAVGGYDARETPLATVEVYDPETEFWTTASPMPTARGRLAVAVIGNTLYALGGRPGEDKKFTAVVEALTLTPSSP